VYWSRLPDWKNQTLTPNPDVIYVKPFFNTKGVGPMVLEIPPADEGSITGTIMGCWQSALEDVGPAGKESNWVPTSAGGKFEVLFRLYGPEKALFDKTWVLGDIELVAAP
jgi:hypothetical protein